MLLHSVIEQNSTDKPSPSTTQKEAKPTQSNNKMTGTLKGKRKDLSMALRHMIDNEQNNVVNLYRQMKKNQRLENAKK